jgi:ABC-type Fe3+ transport system permease subunit
MRWPAPVGELGSSLLVAGAAAVLAYLLTPMVRWVAIRSGARAAQRPLGSSSSPCKAAAPVPV